MPSGGSFVHVPCLSEREPAIQEGRIQTPQSNSVETKSGEERGANTSRNPRLCPKYRRSRFSTKVLNSLLLFWRVSSARLLQTRKRVCVCVCAFVPCALVCACVCAREPQVVEWECSWQEKVSAEVVSLSTLSLLPCPPLWTPSPRLPGGVCVCQAAAGMRTTSGFEEVLLAASLGLPAP